LAPEFRLADFLRVSPMRLTTQTSLAGAESRDAHKKRFGGGIPDGSSRLVNFVLCVTNV